ncbi:MAG: hypothetical protein ABWX82_08855 [Leifsonia sp.]
MDPCILAVRGELETYLPDADEATLLHAADEWVSWLGRAASVADAPVGLRTDFLRRFDRSCPMAASHVWAR